jgi:ADP-ribose pyrophosphatase YjhB (NUDIX family)
MIIEEVNYCLRCGSSLNTAHRDSRLRKVCLNCDWIYFPDPKVAVAALITKGSQVLLVRRANNPARGLWTLPAGFMDAGEDTIAAVEREVLEETGLIIKTTDLIDVLSGQEHPRGAHIIIFYRAEIISGEATPGDDVDRVSFFNRSNLPPMAFKTTQKILQDHPPKKPTTL